jgi:hypothetical protein
MISQAIRFARIAIVLAVACTFSCGGGAGAAGSCGMVAACGGNIVGNWRVTGSCLKVSGTLGDATCPGATIDGSLHITGTTSYAADLTYIQSFILTGTETIGFPASCLTRSGVTLTCDQLNQSFAANPPAPSVASLHCTAAGGGACNCVTTLTAMSVNETGTYITSGGNLTSTQTGGVPDSGGGYCVKGTRLDLTPASMMGGTLIESGDLTLALQ